MIFKESVNKCPGLSVESANNSVTAKHEFKLNGKLPEDQVINDEDKHDKEIDPTDDL